MTTPARRPFTWFQGQSLAEALAAHKLTLDDKPLFAIRVVGFNCEHDPLYERDRHLLA